MRMESGAQGNDLTVLWELQRELHEEMTGVRAASGGTNAAASLDDRLRRYIDQVRAAAQGLDCTGFSISVGFPIGVSASFDFQKPN